MSARLDRRDFFKGAALGVALLEGCARREPVFIEQPIERDVVPAGAAAWRVSVCGQCEARCGIRVRVVDGDAKKIEGNPEHPISRGGVCALGHSALQALYDPDRVTKPLRRSSPRGAAAPHAGAGDFAEATWEQALEAVGSAIADARAAGSPARVAVVTGDDGVGGALWSRLLFAIGAPPLVYDEPFDALVERSAAERVFGRAVLPSYDLERADFVLGLGAPFLDRWRSPVAYARALAEMRARGGRFFHVEPRLSLTAAAADLWLPVRLGTEGTLARALAGAWLAAGRAREQDVARYRALFPHEPPSLEDAARTCDVALPRLEATARALLAARRPVAVSGGTAALASDGLAAVAAGHALDLLFGALGESGGMSIEPGVDWAAALAPGAPRPEPLELLRRRLEERSVDVLLVAEADPLHHAPAGWRLPELLGQVPFVAAIASTLDDTALEADWVLPALVDLEREEVAQAHPTAPGAAAGPVLSIGGAAVDALGEARHPADIALAIAAGQEALAIDVPWQSQQDAAHAAVAADGRFVAAGRDAKRAVERAARNGFLEAGEAASEEGAASQEAPPTAAAPFEPMAATDAAPAVEQAVLRLVPFESIKSARGQGANRPWLQELPDPLASVMWATWIELSPADAAAIGVRHGEWAAVRAAAGDGEALEVGVVVSPAVRPGTASMPIGHGYRDRGRYARGRGASFARLAGGELVAGTAAPALGEVRVRVTPLASERKLALYGRGMGTPERLPRGWGAHRPSTRHDNPPAAREASGTAAAAQADEGERQ